MSPRAYQAYGKGSASFTADAPRDAALGFFAKFPDRRKCSVIEGQTDGHFFTVAYGRASEGKWPQSWKDVTRKGAAELPGVVVTPA